MQLREFTSSPPQAKSHVIIITKGETERVWADPAATVTQSPPACSPLGCLSGVPAPRGRSLGDSTSAMNVLGRSPRVIHSLSTRFLPPLLQGIWVLLFHVGASEAQNSSWPWPSQVLTEAAVL